MTRLQYFPANAAYAFTFGDSMLRLQDFPMFYRTRREAVLAARSCDLVVFRNGAVAVRKPEFSFA